MRLTFDDGLLQSPVFDQKRKSAEVNTRRSLLVWVHYFNEEKDLESQCAEYFSDCLLEDVLHLRIQMSVAKFCYDDISSGTRYRAKKGLQ